MSIIKNVRLSDFFTGLSYIFTLSLIEIYMAYVLFLWSLHSILYCHWQ